MNEPFVVKHYAGDERPSIKGNGFDGLTIGEDREQADNFIAFVNGLQRELSEAKAENESLSNGYQSAVQRANDVIVERDKLKAWYKGVLAEVGPEPAPAGTYTSEAIGHEQVANQWHRRAEHLAVKLLTTRSALKSAKYLLSGLPFYPDSLPHEAKLEITTHWQSYLSMRQPHVDKMNAALAMHPVLKPLLPCPICDGVESCDHTVAERQRAAAPKEVPNEKV